MKVHTIEVNANFVTEALQARFDEVENLWGCPASMSLWDQALDMVANCGLGENVTSPSIFVDNYLINGEFVSKNLEAKYWLTETSFLDYCEHHNLNDLQIAELKASPMFDEFWNEYCENNAMLFNADYACLKF